MSQPRLSICIVNWNAREYLLNALASLACGGVANLEVIVVDNGSTDNSVQAVRSRFPQVTVIENQVNIGFAGANNQALRVAKGSYVLLLNPDCVVHPDALRRLIDFLDATPEAGAVGPKLLNADGSLQFSCRRFPNVTAGIFRNTLLGRLFPNNRYNRQYLMADWDHTVSREADWISGAAMLIRRETLEDVGLLDEKFFMYCEDTDWCYRARQRGWKIYYLPTAEITHIIGKSSDQRPLAMVKEHHTSMAYFYRKHFAEQWPVGFRWLPLLGVKLRMWAIISHYRLRNTIERKA